MRTLVPLRVKVTEGIYDRLAERAGEQNTTMADITRTALARHLRGTHRLVPVSLDLDEPRVNRWRCVWCGEQWTDYPDPSECVP